MAAMRALRRSALSIHDFVEWAEQVVYCAETESCSLRVRGSAAPVLRRNRAPRPYPFRWGNSSLNAADEDDRINS
jgi:hypothetical protein